MAMTARRKILVVEDQSEVRDIAVAALHDANYLVLEAASGESALPFLSAASDIDLLFTDIVMPGELDGFDLARQARSLRPALRILFTSGYAVELSSEAMAEGAFLRKSYRPVQLCEEVARLLSAA
jgi:CheY-like chemotaxis protein